MALNVVALKGQRPEPAHDGPSVGPDLSRLVFLARRAGEVPLERIPAALSEIAAAQASLAAAQSTLTARMVGSLAELHGNGPQTNGEDRWLTADEAAAILKVDRKWLYRRARTLTFSRRLSRKKLLFSEAGLRRWIANRRL